MRPVLLALIEWWGCQYRVRLRLLNRVAQAALLNDGPARSLGAPAGFITSTATGINDAGTVVGYATGDPSRPISTVGLRLGGFSPPRQPSGFSPGEGERNKPGRARSRGGNLNRSLFTHSCTRAPAHLRQPTISDRCWVVEIVGLMASTTRAALSGRQDRRRAAPFTPFSSLPRISVRRLLPTWARSNRVSFPTAPPILSTLQTTSWAGRMLSTPPPNTRSFGNTAAPSSISTRLSTQHSAGS